MTLASITETDVNTWTFKVDGLHLDAPQEAKSRVAKTHDIPYRHLRAKVIKSPFDYYVTVVRVCGES